MLLKLKFLIDDNDATYMVIVSLSDLQRVLIRTPFPQIGSYFNIIALTVCGDW